MANELGKKTNMPKQLRNVDFIHIANNFVTSMENAGRVGELTTMTVPEIMEAAYKNYLAK